LPRKRNILSSSAVSNRASSLRIFAGIIHHGVAPPPDNFAFFKRSLWVLVPTMVFHHLKLNQATGENRLASSVALASSFFNKIS
jgi:hypothetical protein